MQLHLVLSFHNYHYLCYKDFKLLLLQPGIILVSFWFGCVTMQHLLV